MLPENASVVQPEGNDFKLRVIKIHALNILQPQLRTECRQSLLPDVSEHKDLTAIFIIISLKQLKTFRLTNKCEYTAMLLLPRPVKFENNWRKKASAAYMK